MRGKKGSDDILRQLENLENIKQGLNDYDSSFFETLQNERQLLNEFNQLFNLEPELWNLKLEDKRAPSSGFFGMRGKKNDADDTNLLSNEISKDAIDKRAPSSGFFGMRGKKNDDVDDDSVNIDKRAPSGFMGMRGKKEMYDMLSSEKRAPAPGFFGMRGKKGPIVRDLKKKFVEQLLFYDYIFYIRVHHFLEFVAKKVHLNFVGNLLAFVGKKFRPVHCIALIWVI